MKYELIEPVIANNNLSVVERVLTNRGIPLKDVNHYLHTCANDVIDPSGIVRIKEGGQLLIQHLLNQDKIFIVIDSDADGFTSAAILINYLNILFPGLTQNNISYGCHEGKAHGLSDIIDWVLKQDYKLIICPDSSSNDYEEHKRCYENGIDVLVIDHHEADQISPYACIINNQLCDYPTKSLSGAGMVYKFCCYLDELINQNIASKFIDLAILGIIADMMDLRSFEVRELINEGLNNIRNPFFKEMIAANEISINRAGGLNPHTISFYIAPYINAITRVGTMEEKMLLFESMLDFKAYDLIPSTKRGCAGQQEVRVTQAVRTAKNVKNRQTRIIDAGYELLEQSAKSNINKLLVVQLPNADAIPKGVVGLVANKLANTYQQPTLVLSKYDNVWSGSGRGYGIEDFRGFLEHTGLVEFAQGHANAFGVAIEEQNINQFLAVTNELLANQDFIPSYKVDYIWSADNIDEYTILEIADLKDYWGQNLDEPLIAIENIKITTNNIQLLKEKTIKITLPSGLSIIKFNTNEEEFDKMCSSTTGYTVINIVGKCAINEWMGNISPQILLEDWEIKEVNEYYF